MTEASQLSKQSIVAALCRSTHGNLQGYVPIGTAAAKQDPEFVSRLIAWNEARGQIRDSKIALPLLALANMTEPEFVDNALAHLALLSPRDLLRACETSEIEFHGKTAKLTKLVKRYLHAREANPRWFEKTALQHRASLRALYATYSVKPLTDHNNIVIFGRNLDRVKTELPRGSVFWKVAHLSQMSDAEAAEAVTKHRIPWLVASAALGKRMGQPALLMALIERMSPAEVLNNTKTLEKYGVRNDPACRAAFEQALERAVSSHKVATLKASVAAEQVGGVLGEKLKGAQERKIAAAGGIDGDWAIFADCSGSMHQAIEVGRQISATLAKFVKGRVLLIPFDTTPRVFDVTGKTLAEINEVTKYLRAGGGTYIGCGLQYLLDKNIAVQGIAIVSDGGENHPAGQAFHQVWPKYLAQFDEPTVYLYRLDGDRNALASYCGAAGIDLQTFDLSGQRVDYYSLPNMVQTMRTGRYSLADEIMGFPLLKLDDVFKTKKEVEDVA